MRTIIGGNGELKTHTLVKEFIGKHNTSVFVVPTEAIAIEIRERYYELFRARGVDSKRIVGVDQLRESIQRLKPLFIFIDNTKWILRKVLGLSRETIDSCTIELEPSESFDFLGGNP